MKKSIIVFSIWILLIASLSHGTTYGQTTNDYALSTGDSISLPEGSSQQLFIWWFDNNGTPHMGLSDLESVPTWNINGKLNANPDEGDIELSAPFEFDHATYTAPRSLPPQNPVVISVRFPANDTTKEMTTLLCRVYVIAPKNKWYISYNCISYKYTSTKSSSENNTYEYHAYGNASMVVDAPPPDTYGYAHFNAPAENKLENASMSGSMEENSSDLTLGFHGTIVEKDVRHYTGQPNLQFNGIEFEYDPQNIDANGLNAGITFNLKCTDIFWKWDDNSRSLKLVDTYNHTEDNGDEIMMGGQGKTIKKTKAGFIIDYHASKDTSYTDVMGAKHKERSGLMYHGTISYIKDNNRSQGKKGE